MHPRLRRPGRLYCATFDAASVSAAQDLFDVRSFAGVVIVHGWSLMQTGRLGDAAEEVLRITETMAATNSGPTGGASVTAQPISDGDAAHGSTVRSNDTTRLSGSPPDLAVYGWNVREPLTHVYLPPLRPIIKARTGNTRIYWTLSLPAAPSATLTMSASLWFEESL